MSSEIAIEVKKLSKCYQIYEQPRDRLKQFILPRLQRSVFKQPKQYFREFWALKDVSFEVKKGETVGIVGRNGSGKSTLLQMICGTLNPTSGSIQTNGRIAALLELGSGFNPEFSGRENVYLNGAVLGLTRQEIDSRFDDIVAFADIGNFIEQPVKTYSSGMMVRLAFAVAINVDPEILIVDEALSVGDELFQRKCFARIEAIRANGATILFVSHSGSQIVELCDRALLMDSGERLADGKPKKIIGLYQKLLYAPMDRREEVREQIIGAISGEQHERELQEQKNIGSSGSLVLNDFFDPHLQPKSTINYEERGALISRPQLFNLSGNKVNCLQNGEFYFFKYNVQFTSDATNVLFGMLIKTISGVELGGAVSASSLRKALPYASTGSNYQVEFRFQCNLNPGLYFVNAGVYGIRNGEEVYLHRILDACMFRVQPRVDCLISGLVDFNCTHQIHACVVE
ncbi:ABC transporter ATP-binding protein [Pseudomonas sp. MSSRFD41]|uniref:ABC transporter ATP-binding protein n=1 Tax=Pseudomonas sp. MSSRFD41 TaxID=1310370 RepID=UPI001639583F|nr:ABC transporter ATP-binding protein [Pseudomonas sp. MSSRFD41]MBC2655638.1 ABC transporter ATP-binding protein [Pseudomonas sp. MSSRFD41]